jgi:hypothetical protein
MPTRGAARFGKRRASLEIVAGARPGHFLCIFAADTAVLVLKPRCVYFVRNVSRAGSVIRPGQSIAG